MAPYSTAEFRQRLLSAAPGAAKFGFQGLRSEDAIAVEEYLPLDFLIACDWGLDGPDWDSRLRFFSAERGENFRKVWSHDALVEAYNGELGKSIRAYLNSDENPSFILPYRSTEFIEALSEESSGRISILSNPVGLKKRLDDKIEFVTEAERLGLRPPEGEIIEVKGIEKGLLGKWGSPLVVRERIGSSGNQTHLVETPEELEALKMDLHKKLGGQEPVIVCRFIAGPSVGATGIVYGGKARMSHPSIIVSGLAGSSMHRFSYAGSDYTAYHRLPESSRRNIEEATLAIGNWAGSLGYRGIYGVDFVVHEGKAYTLELNPRLLGTTQLLTELELRAGASPATAFWHIAEYFPVKAAEEEVSGAFRELGALRLEGFQLVLRNTSNRPVQIGRSMEPGIYEISSGVPRYIRKGSRIADLAGPAEFLLTSSPPEKGKILYPRSVLFKVEGLETLHDEAVENLMPYVSNWVECFSKAAELVESPG